MENCMKLYRVSMAGDFGDTGGRAMWASKKSDVPALKREISEERVDANEHCEADVEIVEFENTKTGILALLNRYADQA
jgi:hypothetical protein